MTAVSNTALSDLGLPAPAQGSSTKAKPLGQEDFLRLMTTQMKFQDPFKPLDSSQFLGQMAQFSTVSGIQSLNDSFASLTSSMQSNQALQATQLVGHGVLVASSSSVLYEGEGLGGAVDVPASGTVTVEVRDSAGALVRTLDLGTQPAGLANFSWDGLDEGGKALPSGPYQIAARVQQGSSTAAADTYALALVNSVSLGSGGLTLNLHGLDAVSLGAVRQIY